MGKTQVDNVMLISIAVGTGDMFLKSCLCVQPGVLMYDIVCVKTRMFQLFINICMEIIE